jgi:malonyl-CoA O-methyltransferase
MHPALMLRGKMAQFLDPATGRKTRPLSFPHELSDFVMAALRAGLKLEEFTEHRMDEPTAARCPRARKYLGWPMLVMMKLRPQA